MRWFSVVAMAAVVISPAAAQNLISAKAGVVHYSEGDVLVAGKPVEAKLGLFTTMKPGETLTTAEGRAEVLLAPGVTLRIADNSMVKLVNSDVSDVRLELLDGNVILEAAETVKENKTTISYKGFTMSPMKDGLYSIETEPVAQVRVWDGEADVKTNGKTIEVKGGRLLALDGGDKVTKFDKDDTDALYRWARRRSNVLALATVSGARSADNWNTGGGARSWLWNPYLRMFTYVPLSGVWNSPFGWSFYSPGAVHSIFYPPVYVGGGGSGIGSSPTWSPSYNPNYGYNTVPMRSPGGVSMGGGGGGVSAAPAPPPSRGDVGGGAVGRGGGGGGRR